MMKESPQTRHPAHRGCLGWPLAVAVIAITVILVAAGLYLFHSLRTLPGDAVEQGRQVLRDLESVAAAFNRGTVETSFLSYATEVRGTSYLQFATLEQMEVFRRTDRASTLWGTLQLPDVMVEATAPVEYTYFLDLDAEWRFERRDHTLYVVAPKPRFNTPAVDASEIRYEVRRGSVLRDSDAALVKLKEGITTMAKMRARENLALVRELGRRVTEEFVASWLAEAFGDGGAYRVEVVFADEVEGPPLALPGRELAVPEAPQAPGGGDPPAAPGAQR